MVWEPLTDRKDPKVDIVRGGDVEERTNLLLDVVPASGSQMLLAGCTLSLETNACEQGFVRYWDIHLRRPIGPESTSSSLQTISMASNVLGTAVALHDTDVTSWCLTTYSEQAASIACDTRRMQFEL